jgi:DNA polymerase-1
MYTYIHTLQGVRRVAYELSTTDVIAVDTENTGLDPYTARPLIVSLSSRTANYVIDLTTQDAKDAYTALQPLLEDPNILKIGHNLTYDWKIFHHQAGIMMEHMHDTMIADRLIYAVGYKVPFALKDVTARRLGITRDKSIRSSFIDWQIGSVFSEEQLRYAAEDTSFLFPIWEQQMREIANKKLERVYQLEMAIIAPTAVMEYTGVNINVAMLQDMVEPFSNYVKAADKALQDLFIANGAAETIVVTEDGYYCLNTNSTDQLKAALQRVGVDVPSLNAKDVQRWELLQRKKRKGKKIDDFNYLDIVDDEEIATAIDQYPGVENKYLRALGFLKGARILLNTFILGIIERINPISKRIHPNFNSLGAMATGRYSSSGPNFQNLPNDKKLKLLGLGRYSIRNAIEASKGRTLLISDYSGIELVILAVLSGDTHLMDEILRGDIHTYVTQEVLGYKDINRKNKKDEPHKLWRDAAKTLSYGIAYGTTGRNLSETLNIMLASQGYRITPQEGDELIERWYKLFPKTAAYLNSNARSAVLNGYVTDTWGRRRNWDKTTFVDKWKRLAAEREGKNAPIQGTSATMTKRAIQLFWENANHRRARIIITVHDEIVVEANNQYLEEATRILKWAMEEAIRETLPSVADDVGKYESTSVSPKASNKYDK